LRLLIRVRAEGGAGRHRRSGLEVFLPRFDGPDAEIAGLPETLPGQGVILGAAVHGGDRVAAWRDAAAAGFFEVGDGPRGVSGGSVPRAVALGQPAAAPRPSTVT